MNRIDRMNHLLGVCRRSGWDSDTPNIAGILENLLKPFGLTQRTNRDYVRAVIGIMEWEKKTGINSLSYEQFQEYRGKQSSSHKEQKPRKEHDSNRAIYSSPLSQLNPAERCIDRLWICDFGLPRFLLGIWDSARNPNELISVA